jgi:small subunit ribosomal protein S20
LPNIKSAMKRVKIAERNNLRNRMIRSQMKTTIKKYNEAVSAGSDDARELMVKAIQVVDKAAAKGAIHKNAANRKKTQIARKMQAIS